MTFDELLEEVYLITNRRDLEAESKSAIKKSTLKAHKTDFYSKDIFETGITFPTKDFMQSLDIYSIFNNFRAWKYFRRMDTSDNIEEIRASISENPDSNRFIDIITVDETLDSYRRNRSDIAYVAGRMLEIRSHVDFDRALIGFYALPIVVENKYVSWIAEQYPFVIIHEAARLVFGSIGKMEEAQNQRLLAAEELAELKIGAVTDVGY